MKDFLLTMLALFALVLVLGALLAGLLAGNRTSHDMHLPDIEPVGLHAELYWLRATPLEEVRRHG